MTHCAACCVRCWLNSTAFIHPVTSGNICSIVSEESNSGSCVSCHTTGYNALATNTGMYAYFPSTNANYQLTVRTNDGTGSGWAGADHPDWTQINFAEVADRAIAKARLSRNPVAIELPAITSAASLASCVALCASIGWPTRSPMAKICGTLVRICRSTAM